MRILIIAKGVTGMAEEGGSSRFMHLVGKTLSDMGHYVLFSNQPEYVINDKYGLIISSHKSILAKIKANPAPKICISHGIFGEELFTHGADRYISISEEVQEVNKLRGIESEVIGQPIRVGEIKEFPREKLENILIIRRHPMDDDPFEFLKEDYNLKISDMSYPIEDQIEWADLCITLGRGALESMAQARPVIVADNRPYIGAYGDGYVSSGLINEIARNNFSGRRFKIPVTKEWLLEEIAKYDSMDGLYLWEYVRKHHEANMIVSRYLEPITFRAAPKKVSFGVLVNDIQRLNMCLQQSEITGEMHFVKNPDSATSGLNKLLDTIQAEDAEIAVLTHQDMYYRRGWVDQVKDRIKQLPNDWIVAGIVGKDHEGRICGRFQDMRIPIKFDTSSIHEFPYPACCFDECCIIVNMKSGFRFDELPGFDLYGTLCVLQAWEMGGTAWVIDAPAEHYCMRPFTWVPDETFKDNYKMLFDRYKQYRVDSTAIGLPKEEVDRIAFMVSAE